MFLSLAATLLSHPAPATAHSAPHALWLGSETLNWLQPDGNVDWDVRIQALDREEWERPADPEPLPVCWQEDLYDEIRTLPGEAAIVWLRSRADGQTSAWMGPQLVSVPEPGLALGMAAGGVVAALLSGRRSTRRRSARGAAHAGRSVARAGPQSPGPS